MFRTAQNLNKASCSTAHGGTEWAFSLESKHGEAIYALVLSANAQGKNVKVVGAGDCNVWGDRERPRYVIIDD